MFRIVVIWGGLLLCILSLQLGNGLQSTIVGLRTVAEGFSPFAIAAVMSSFYVGYAVGSLWAPRMVPKVGHIRVIAGLAALAGAAAAFYLVAVHWIVWAIIRFFIGIALSGMYAAAEAWINARTGNAERGRVFAVYMLAQLGGLCGGQFLVPLADPMSVTLYALFTALFALAAVPVALMPAAEASRDTPELMGLRALFTASPLGFAGCLVSGFIWAALMGGGPVFGGVAGLTEAQTSTFIAALVAGGIAMQFPLGWLSDHLDRRTVLLGIVILAGAAALGGWLILAANPALLLAFAVVFGGLSFPLYSVAVAHTNDHLRETARIPASAGMVLLFGLGSIGGPAAVSAALDAAGAPGFFAILAAANGFLALFCIYRMAVRRA